ncbi:MAG: hypothetical protein ACOX6T_13830, partial [Myxococcales bacterium]
MNRKLCAVAAAVFACVMTGCSSPDDEGTTPDASGTTEAPFALLHAKVEIPAGSTYNIPDNKPAASSNVALFSEQKDLFTIRNDSGAELTIKSITLTLADGTEAEELTLRDAESMSSPPLENTSRTLAPEATFDFYVRFYSVFSGERGATLSIDYEGASSGTFNLKLTGTGRPSDNAHPFSGATLKAHKLFGSTGTDEQVTGMVADAAGNAYFLLQTKEVPGYDGYYYDLVVGKIGADGALGWAKIFSRSTAWEWSADPGQNDETGGSPNAIVLDGDHLYVAGSASAGNTTNNNAALVLKIATADGSLVWSKLWRPEWPSGSPLDRMSATGYAVAVGGERVFVTGTCGDGGAHGTLGSNSSVFVLGLEKSDGSLGFAQAVDVAAGYNARGYAVVADSAGANVWVGGLTNASGLLLKLTGTDGATPTVAWARRLDMGTGSNVYGLAFDGSDLFLALDRRGASTYFSVARRVSGKSAARAWTPSVRWLAWRVPWHGHFDPTRWTSDCFSR